MSLPDTFKFVLCKGLQKDDPAGKYVYKASKNPNVHNEIIVDTIYGQTRYKFQDVERSIDNGHWIITD